MFLDQIVGLVIRPPRAEYSVEADLIGPLFTIKGRRYKRHDLQLVNKRGHILECSHYLPDPPPQNPLPCVVYSHGNSGCRADANDCVPVLLPLGITVFALDFSGSGHSQGEYVSLGKFETEDLEAAVDYLRSEQTASSIGLWGRSMGAVTSIMYGCKDPSIAGMVLDSPFSSLNGLVLELVDYFKIPLPKFSVKVGVLPLLRRGIRQKADFDINDLDALALAPTCFSPALFAHATEDDFIQPHHSTHLSEAYAGDKNRITFPGDHNSPRPPFFFDSVAIFFHNVLQPPPTHEPELALPETPQKRVLEQQRSATSQDPNEDGSKVAEPSASLEKSLSDRLFIRPSDSPNVSADDLTNALAHLSTTSLSAYDGQWALDDSDSGKDEDLLLAIELSMQQPNQPVDSSTSSHG